MAGSPGPLYFVIDGPPGPEAGRFVDVEDHDGKNPAGGSGLEWEQVPSKLKPGSTLWRLGPFHPRVRELDAKLGPEPELGAADWSGRPIRVVIATEAGVHDCTDLPMRLVADADYVIALGGVMKDRDGRFRGRVDLAGDQALQELALDGPVEYVRWPA